MEQFDLSNEENSKGQIINLTGEEEEENQGEEEKEKKEAQKLDNSEEIIEQIPEAEEGAAEEVGEIAEDSSPEIKEEVAKIIEESQLPRKNKLYETFKTLIVLCLSLGAVYLFYQAGAYVNELRFNRQQIVQNLSSQNNLNLQSVSEVWREFQTKQRKNLSAWQVGIGDLLRFLPEIQQDSALQGSLNNLSVLTDKLTNGEAIQEILTPCLTISTTEPETIIIENIEGSSVSSSKPTITDTCQQPLVLLKIDQELKTLESLNIQSIKPLRQQVAMALNALGLNSGKRYVVFIQYPQVSRPIGGVLSSAVNFYFNKGRLQNWWVDSIQSLNNAMINLVPPWPFEVVTNKWFYHDLNWFFDFPTSAEKLINYYSLAPKDNTSVGNQIDGVIVLNPSFIREVLKITGPIVINSEIVNNETFDSFLGRSLKQAIQSFGALTNEGEELDMFLQALIKRIISLPSENLAQIVSIFNNSTTDQSVLVYFRDNELENYFQNIDITGQLKDSPNDYLAVSINSIARDFVEDNRKKMIFLQTNILADGRVINQLSIEATSLSLADNRLETYLKIYLPKGATILEAKGGSLKPMEDFSEYYKRLNYKTDSDISLIKQSMARDTKNKIEVYEENDKTVVGTWVKLSLNEFYLKYQLPQVLSPDSSLLSWKLVVEKQSGQNIDFAYKLIPAANFELQSTLFPFDEWLPLFNDLEAEFQLQTKSSAL